LIEPINAALNNEIPTIKATNLSFHPGGTGHRIKNIKKKRVEALNYLHNFSLFFFSLEPDLCPLSSMWRFL